MVCWKGLRPAWVKIRVVKNFATPASDSLPETLSKPTIWAKPNFIIPNGMPVIIWCQGMHKATEYQLYFEGQLSALEKSNPPGMMNKVKFSIHTMTSKTAGQYRCSYRSGELWSNPSDPLDLVITGGEIQPPTAQIWEYAGGVLYEPCDHSPQRDLQMFRFL